jgi:hypothetical protein
MLAIDVAIRFVALVLVGLVCALDLALGSFVAFLVAVMIIGVLRIMTGKLDPWWRRVFVFKAVFIVSFLIVLFLAAMQVSDMESFLPVFVAGMYVILVGLQLTGVVVDLRRKIARHWSHWVGLCAHLAINVLTAVLVVVAFSSIRLEY